MEGLTPFPIRRPGRSTFRAVLFFGLLISLSVSACSDRNPVSPARIDGEASAASASGESSTPVFRDVTEESGLRFVHFNGASGDLFFPEIIGSGAALFDADRDGDLDLYLVQGALWPGRTPDQALAPPDTTQEGAALRDRLFRNDLEIREDGTRSVRWTDITEESGIDGTEYGAGVAVGDYDGDGWDDLYVYAYGNNRLWRHLGLDDSGVPRFEDATSAAQADDVRWSTAASWADFDRDGDLDLYVANYVDFRHASSQTCRQPSGSPDYCGPLSFQPESDRLLRNSGNGTFEDVSGRAGILAVPGNGLGVTAADLDDDGWIDLYVANDQMANSFWRNQQADDEIRFLNDAAFAGAAVNVDGKPEASMGVDSGDLDNDGDLDLFITHLDGESNTLYLNEGAGLFMDRSSASRLGGPSVPHTGFGTALFDFDNDGLLDVVAVNGAVTIIQELAAQGELFPFAQPNQLYRGLGLGEAGVPLFEEVPPKIAGDAFPRMETSRAVAVGDLDNDGDADLILTNVAGPARVLRNEVGRDRSWIGLIPVRGEPATIDPAARVRLELPDGRTLHRRVRRDGSFLSSHDPRVLVGLGSADRVDEVVVVWADGSQESWGDLSIDRYHTLHAGSGETIPAEDRL